MFINFFNQLIFNRNKKEVSTLRSVLNHFSTRNHSNGGIFPGKNLMVTQTALLKTSCLVLQRNILVKINLLFFIFLIYMNYDYWFTYKHFHELLDAKIRDMDNIVVNSSFKIKPLQQKI